MWMVYIPILVVCVATARGPRCDVSIAEQASPTEKACAEKLVEMTNMAPEHGFVLGVAGVCLRRGLDLVR